MMRACVNQIYNNPDGKGAGMRTRSRPKASGRQLRSVERSGQWAPASLRPLVPRYWYETQILNLANHTIISSGGLFDSYDREAAALAVLTTMPRKLSAAEWDDAFNTLEEDGFVIIPSYFQGEQLEEMAAAMRRALPTWEDVRADPPEGFSGTATCDWPFSELVLNKTGAQQPELADFARRWLGTDDIQIRVGIGLARYPGYMGKREGVHVGALVR